MACHCPTESEVGFALCQFVSFGCFYVDWTESGTLRHRSTFPESNRFAGCVQNVEVRWDSGLFGMATDLRSGVCVEGCCLRGST